VRSDAQVLYGLGIVLWLAGLTAAKLTLPALVPACLVGMIPFLIAVLVAAEVITRPRT
jgi:hypothetical protein